MEKENHPSVASLMAQIRAEREARAFWASELIISGFQRDHLIDRMARFAAYKHAWFDQRRKYTSDPYIVHPQEVAAIAMEFTDDPSVISGCWGHDLVEDCEVTREELAEKFGQDVAYLIDGVTDVSRPEDGNREVRKALDREHVAQGCGRIHLIKLCDVISNIKNIAELAPEYARKKYLQEKEELLLVTIKAPEALQRRARETLDRAWAALGTTYEKQRGMRP